MCITSNSNTVFLCKICNTNIKDTETVQPNVRHLSILDSYEM